MGQQPGPKKCTAIPDRELNGQGQGLAYQQNLCRRLQLSNDIAHFAVAVAVGCWDDGTDFFLYEAAAAAAAAAAEVDIFVVESGPVFFLSLFVVA